MKNENLAAIVTGVVPVSIPAKWEHQFMNIIVV